MGRTVNYINPNAEVSSTLEVYKRYSFDRAYMGEAFFWATTPKKGDVIKMKFLPPITIDKLVSHLQFACLGRRFPNNFCEINVILQLFYPLLLLFRSLLPSLPWLASASFSCHYPSNSNRNSGRCRKSGKNSPSLQNHLKLY